MTHTSHPATQRMAWVLATGLGPWLSAPLLAYQAVRRAQYEFFRYVAGPHSALPTASRPHAQRGRVEPLRRADAVRSHARVANGGCRCICSRGLRWPSRAFTHGPQSSFFSLRWGSWWSTMPFSRTKASERAPSCPRRRCLAVLHASRSSARRLQVLLSRRRAQPPRDPAPALACTSSHPDRTHNGPAATSARLSFHSRNLRPSTSPGRRRHRSVRFYCGQGARGELACQRAPLLHLRTFRQRRIHSQRRVREPRSGQRVHPRPQHGAGHMDGPAHEACRGEGLGDARHVAGALRKPRCEAPKLPGPCPPRVLRSVLAFHLSLTRQRLATTLSPSVLRHRLRPLTPPPPPPPPSY